MYSGRPRLTGLVAIVLMVTPLAVIAQPAEPADTITGQHETERGDVINLSGDVAIAADQTVTGDVVAVGGSANVRGRVKGNVVSVDGSLYLHDGSHVTGDAIAIGGEVVREPGARVDGSKIQISAPWAGKLVVTEAAPPAAGQPGLQVEPGTVKFGGGVRVETDETVNDDVVTFGGPAEILGTVNGNVVAFGGPVDVFGEVNGDTVAFGGSVRLHHDARVSGDAVAFGGTVEKVEGAVLGGQQVSFGGVWDILRGGTLSPYSGPRGPMRHILRDWPGGLRVATNWLFGGLTTLVIIIILVLALPRHTDVIATKIAEEPGRSLLYGLVGGLLVLPVLVVLVLLVVTWVLIPFYLALVAALAIIGGVSMNILIGRQAARPIWRWRGRHHHVGRDGLRLWGRADDEVRRGPDGNMAGTTNGNGLNRC